MRDILDDLAVSNCYIHADAALSGMILPFVDDPQPYGFDAGFDSVAVSGHKMIGAPLPCGVALTRKEYVSRIARSIEYVGVLDTTLTGSRSAFAPLMIWYAFQHRGLEGFRELVSRSLSQAEYAVERFNEVGILAWRNRNSVTCRVPEAISGSGPQVADSSLRGHRPHHHHAERHAGVDRRARGRCTERVVSERTGGWTE